MQGGTIKLMVKTLGIDLEEDRGDVIGLDVQDKVNITITTISNITIAIIITISTIITIVNIMTLAL